MSLSLRLIPILLVLGACGDSNGNAPTTHLVGGDAGVADYPRIQTEGRLLILQCCSFPAAPDLRMTTIQGIESPGYEIIGKSFKLEVSYGPYTSDEVEQGFYERLGRRSVDGVRLTRFRLKSDATPNYPAARHLWIAKVGGRQIGDVFHDGWGLRMAGDCASAEACGSMLRLVNSIRF